jgi:hypothetical protein
MSYVDALYDRGQDRIHIVERVNGERIYREFPANYIFYYDDPRGKFRTVYGTPVARFSSRSNKEFQKELRISILYSDVWKSTTLVPLRLNYKRRFLTLRLTLTQ